MQYYTYFIFSFIYHLYLPNDIMEKKKTSFSYGPYIAIFFIMYPPYWFTYRTIALVDAEVAVAPGVSEDPL